MNLAADLKEGRSGRWRAFIIDKDNDGKILAQVGLARGLQTKEEASSVADAILSWGAAEARARTNGMRKERDIALRRLDDYREDLRKARETVREARVGGMWCGGALGALLAGVVFVASYFITTG